MRSSLRFGLLVVILIGLPRIASIQASDYWPEGEKWASISPGEAGFDQAALEKAVAGGLSQNSRGVLVLRGGKIVAESYSEGWTPQSPHSLASATKSMLSILVCMALDERKFKGLDQRIADFAPQWKGTPKEAITLRHMISMTSGLDHRGVEVDTTTGDQFTVNAEMKLKDPPGTNWSYNTPAYHMIFRLIEKATGESLEAYAKRKLFDPIGMESYAWAKRDMGSVTNYYRLQCSTRDMARFGLFIQRGGKWKGQQLVSADYFKMATAPSQELNPAYGFLFWLNAEPGVPPRGGNPSYQFKGSPRDTIAALGAGSQDIMVVPSLDLVVVRQGEAPSSPDFAAELLHDVVASLRQRP